jgi:hypothetical protein
MVPVDMKRVQFIKDKVQWQNLKTEEQGLIKVTNLFTSSVEGPYPVAGMMVLAYFHGLLNDTASSSDYMQSDVGVISQT